MDLNINEEQKNNSENKRCNYLVLVNKENKIPDNWENIIELIEVKNAFGKFIKIEKKTLENFINLRNNLLKKGVDIELDNAYRSMFKQKELSWEFEEKYGVEYAWKYAALPGYSEHHTWLAIDICIKKNWELISENHEMIVECEIFEKIHEKLADYWFILRYLEWKDDITWYSYEPWHLRYIGDIDVAKKIMKNWRTLEEYLNQLNK